MSAEDSESTWEREDFNHEPNYSLDHEPVALMSCPKRGGRKEANQKYITLEISITTKITLHLRWQELNYPVAIPPVGQKELLKCPLESKPSFSQPYSLLQLFKFAPASTGSNFLQVL